MVSASQSPSREGTGASMALCLGRGTKTRWGFRAVPDTKHSSSEPSETQKPIALIASLQELQQDDEAAAATRPAYNNAAVKLLLTNRLSTSALAVRGLAKEVNVSEKTALRYLHASAQLCSLAQHKSLEDILRYIWRMTWGKVMLPQSFLSWHAFDETSSRLRVASSIADGELMTQLAKVFVIQSAWLMIVRVWSHVKQAWTPLVLRGSQAPALRVSDTTSAESVAAVLTAAPQPPPLAAQLFPDQHRLLECDEAKSNLKAVKLLTHNDPAPKTLTCVCLAHKTHACADKVWSVDRDALTGLTRLLLSIAPGQQLMRFMSALLQEIETRCSFLVSSDGILEPLSLAAQEFRRRALALHMPSKHFCRKRGVISVACAIWNGDWSLAGDFQHRCLGPDCCSSRRHCVLKMKVAARRILKSLKPSRLCRDNWLQWARPVDFVCLLTCMHDMFRITFLAAFTAPCPVPEESLGQRKVHEM